MTSVSTICQQIRLTPLPARVAGVENFCQNLNGIWSFHPDPEDDFYLGECGAHGAGWAEIEAPGEWAMQGFEVETGKSAGYRREFDLPDSWRGKRIKLKCDGVYSETRIWCNGQEAGSHLGGFTAFEVDLTPLVRPGRNTLALGVRSESIADQLASGIKYATHDLGGIIRSIHLLAVPNVNVADLYTRTEFDRNYRNGTLFAQVQIANESNVAAGDAGLLLVLRNGGVEVQSASAKLDEIQAGACFTSEVRLEIEAPRPWDPEHPHLYVLECSLTRNGEPVETIERRVGFRQVEVRGNQVFVNNRPIKLRGVNRHDADPLRGRSEAPGACRKDVELFLEMNCNLIRTSHYPPPEDLLHACDELGMFVEIEAPFCWANDNSRPEALDYTIRAEIETVLRDRSHPSVILWSIANESAPWGRNFEAAHRDYLRSLDATRPWLFEISSATNLNENPPLDIDVLHYPGFPGTELASANPRPVFFGEYAHLNVYNRSELMTDPGLRDIWGLGVSEMWERMQKCTGCLGGAIWSGIDDYFVMPQGGAVGYGEWGVLDVWRRPRPEYWHLKKIYSPLRITMPASPIEEGVVCLNVENRQLFSDLAEVRFEWMRGLQQGIARTSGAPGASAHLKIPCAYEGILEVSAYDARERLVDHWRFILDTIQPLAPTKPCGKAAASRGSACIGASLEKNFRFETQGRPCIPPRVSEKTFESRYRISAGGSVYEIDEATGMLTAASVAGVSVSINGPILMVLPIKKEPDSKVSVGGQQNRCLPAGLRESENAKMPSFSAPDLFNPVCSGWRVKTVSLVEESDEVVMRVSGSYDEAGGEYVMRFSPEGIVDICYDFRVKNEVTPRQIGLVFRLPRAFDTLYWRRKGQWQAYPGDHIGRSEGNASAFPTPPDFEHRSQPGWIWALDCTASGSNDFRSTKFGIIEAALCDSSSMRFGACSDGRHHVRAWMDGDSTQLLIAEFANEGAANFFNERVLPNPTIAAGGSISGSARIYLASGSC